MSYATSKLAVRDSFEDEDVSDDVEDEVFIRDGRNGFKVDEERGVKRPLMAPRRKTKSNQLHNEIGRRPPCRALCAPCCYGVIALAALLGLIMLVVSLVMWFPFPLEQVTKFWNVGQSHFGGVLVPCTELIIDDVWTKILPKLTVESAVRLNDVNGDGILDVIIGYGTGADGHDVPDFVCTLYFGGVTPCLGGVIALDGRTGAVIWQHWTSHPIFMVDCSTDLTNDKTNDCLISGKGGVLKLVNGHDGSTVWQFMQDGRAEELFVDVFSAQYVQDVDGDGLPDVLVAHTQDSSSGQTGSVQTGHLMLVNGQKGTILQKVSTPNEEETYFAPQVMVHLDGVSIVVFGTGGQSSPGGLYAIPLHDLVKGDIQQAKALYRDEIKGVMSPPILADLNQDGSEDIVAAMFNSVVVAFNGLNLQPLWNFSFPGSETSSAPTPCYFNDDSIPDFLVKYQTGPGFPVYYSSQATVLDGKTGVPLLEKPVVDTAGTQMGGLSISVEGFGNDLILYWIANCLHHEGPTKPFSFMQGSSIQAQSRADICQLLYNSTLSTTFVALNQHIEPPGITVYSSDDRRELEYNSSVNTSAGARHYLDTHPDFFDIYGNSRVYNKESAYEKKQFDGDSAGTSNFRHRADESVLEGNSQNKGTSYFYEGDYPLANHGRNRVPNDGGEQEEMIAAEFQGNSEYPNVRKHGGTHPIDQTWQQQQQGEDGNIPLTYSNMMESNPASNRVSDYDQLYDPISAESLGGNQQGFQLDDQQNKRTIQSRAKREATHHIHGLQRLTSLGTLAPPLWTSSKNDSIDLVFVTYWINSMTDAQLISKEKKQGVTGNSNRKYHNLEAAVAKNYLGYKWQDKSDDLDVDWLNLNMGQATAYRLRISCKCRIVGSGERCSTVLPYRHQSWPEFMGHNGYGHFRPRHN